MSSTSQQDKLGCVLYCSYTQKKYEFGILTAANQCYPRILMLGDVYLPP